MLTAGEIRRHAHARLESNGPYDGWRVPRQSHCLGIAALYTAMPPTTLHQLLVKGATIPRNLRPTLAVRLAIPLLVESMPRDRNPAAVPDKEA